MLKTRQFLANAPMSVLQVLLANRLRHTSLKSGHVKWSINYTQWLARGCLSDVQEASGDGICNFQSLVNSFRRKETKTVTRQQTSPGIAARPIVQLQVTTPVQSHSSWRAADWAHYVGSTWTCLEFAGTMCRVLKFLPAGVGTKTA